MAWRTSCSSAASTRQAGCGHEGAHSHCNNCNGDAYASWPPRSRAGGWGRRGWGWGGADRKGKATPGTGGARPGRALCGRSCREETQAAGEGTGTRDTAGTKREPGKDAHSGCVRACGWQGPAAISSRVHKHPPAKAALCSRPFAAQWPVGVACGVWRVGRPLLTLSH